MYLIYISKQFKINKKMVKIFIINFYKQNQNKKECYYQDQK